MKKAESYFEHGCHRCGLIDEANFVFSSNGAVKQICNGCRSYVKFFNKALVPTHLDIKKKIWYIVEQDLNEVTKAKEQIQFCEGLTGLQRQLEYWRLYLQIRKNAS